jgi:hypothetical protein
MNIILEVACKQLVSTIDEAMANIGHQIVISAPQRPDRRQKNASRVSSRPVIYRTSLEPAKSTDAA